MSRSSKDFVFCYKCKCNAGLLADVGSRSASRARSSELVVL